MKKGIAIQILTYAIPIIAVLFILTVVMRRIGLIKTKESKALDKKANNIVTTDVLNPSKYQSTYNFKRISPEILGTYVDDIHEATDGWGTDEATIYSTFKKLYNKLNVSQLAEAYRIKFGKDLRAVLVDELDTTELAKLDSIISSLPERS